VVPAPIPRKNEAHCEVRGRKSPGIANRLRDASVWVSNADDGSGIPIETPNAGDRV
jgi:hypothetical protein